MSKCWIQQRSRSECLEKLLIATNWAPEAVRCRGLHLKLPVFAPERNLLPTGVCCALREVESMREGG